MSKLKNLKWNELTDYQKEVAIDTLKDKDKKINYTRKGAIFKLKEKTFKIVYDKYDDDFDILF